jgi:exodeoxyribonuclease-3
MRVITANVNGVRAAARRGGLGWLAAQEADVLCLQEVRATDGQLAQALGDAGLGAWHVAHTEAADKGRAGVAVVSREAPSRVQVGVGAQEFATCGRWVEIDLPTAAGPVTIVSTYVHTGEADTLRQVEKYRFLDAMNERMAAWSAAGDLALVTGDLNVAHREDDLKNWKAT